MGFAKENHGAAALAGGIGYLILTAVSKSINDKLDMGVLAGMLCGIVAGNLYNQFKDIKLPEYLAFFGGKRFVPIITGLVCVFLGLLCGYIWPAVQIGIDWVGHFLIGAGGLGLFIYGVLNRLLLVTGLHHILNSLVWFVFGSYTGPDGKVVTVAVTRLRFVLRDASRTDQEAFKLAGIAGVMKASENVWHVVAGQRAPAIAAALNLNSNAPPKKPDQISLNK